MVLSICLPPSSFNLEVGSQPTNFIVYMMGKDLHVDDYRRYGRQMILDGFGLPGDLTLAVGLHNSFYNNPNSGQLNLQRSSIAVVGAGGLGCPALQYLAAAGVGLFVVSHPTLRPKLKSSLAIPRSHRDHRPRCSVFVQFAKANSS